MPGKSISAQDLEHLITAGVLEVEEEADLQQVSRRLITQQVCALLKLHRAGGARVRSQVLSQASTMMQLSACMEGLQEEVAQVSALPMEQWVRRIAVHLGAEHEETLLAALREESSDAPEQMLASVRGIGARRLDQLYSAGLYTVADLCQANPSDLAAVTGFPLNLTLMLITAAKSHSQLHSLSPAGKSPATDAAAVRRE